MASSRSGCTSAPILSFLPSKEAAEGLDRLLRRLGILYEAPHRVADCPPDVRHEDGIGRRALNTEGEAAGRLAERPHAGELPGQLHEHLQIQVALGVDGAAASERTERRRDEVQVVDADAVGRDA